LLVTGNPDANADLQLLNKLGLKSTTVEAQA
jgi:hypothetical protein